MEGKQSGWLTKAFMGAVKLATIGVAGAVAWQMFLDPLFFPVIHDTSNIIAQAWMMKMNSMFSWIPQHAGLAHEPGLLTGFMKSFLAKEIEALTPASGEAAAAAFGGSLSLDSF